MRIGTQKCLYKLLSFCLAGLSVVCAVELVQPGALAQNLCNEFPHGCFQAPPAGIPCKSITCGTAFQLIQQESVNCTIPGYGDCNAGQWTGLSADYFTSTATTSWWNCKSVSNNNAQGCDDACATCANMNLFKLSCTAIDQCGTGIIPQCAASVGFPCN